MLKNYFILLVFISLLTGASQSIDIEVEDPDSFEQMFGKALDILEAARMLKSLSGRKHKVWSSTGLIIHKNLDFNQNTFYNRDKTSRSFSDKKEDDPWI